MPKPPRYYSIGQLVRLECYKHKSKHLETTISITKAKFFLSWSTRKKQISLIPIQNGFYTKYFHNHKLALLFFCLCKFRYLSYLKIFLTTCHSNFCGLEGIHQLNRGTSTPWKLFAKLAFQNINFNYF